jgi:hypothetical protein
VDQYLSRSSHNSDENQLTGLSFIFTPFLIHSQNIVLPNGNTHTHISNVPWVTSNERVIIDCCLETTKFPTMPMRKTISTPALELVPLDYDVCACCHYLSHTQKAHILTLHLCEFKFKRCGYGWTKILLLFSMTYSKPSINCQHSVSILHRHHKSNRGRELMGMHARIVMPFHELSQTFVCTHGERHAAHDVHITHDHVLYRTPDRSWYISPL